MVIIHRAQDNSWTAISNQLCCYVYRKSGHLSSLNVITAHWYNRNYIVITAHWYNRNYIVITAHWYSRNYIMITAHWYNRNYIVISLQAVMLM